MEDKFDELIKQTAKKHSIPWLLLKAQVKTESAFDPHAVSSCGAIGLLQIMPETAADLGFTEDDLYNPAKNLDCGAQYLREQYDKFPEIPDPIERWKFALGAYVGGRGYINKALKLARIFEKKTISQPGHWQRWIYASQKLRSSECKVRGRRPDWRQIGNYVARIMRYWREYQENA